MPPTRTESCAVRPRPRTNSLFPKPNHNLKLTQARPANRPLARKLSVRPFNVMGNPPRCQLLPNRTSSQRLFFPMNISKSITAPIGGWQPHGLALKKLISALQVREVPHYCPLYEKRYRSPNGRIRSSFNPLFANYVFVHGTDEERYQALTTNQICRMAHVVDEHQLVVELRQVQAAIESGIPLTPESKLVRGQRVRVKSGPFRGFEGQIIRREGKTRLLLTIAFLESGVSMELDECQVGLIG